MSAGTNFYCEIFHCESLGLQINDEVGIYIWKIYIWKIVRGWHHQLAHLNIHKDWSRSVFRKKCEISKCHFFLISHPIFIYFSLFCRKNCTLSFKIDSTLEWISPLSIERDFVFNSGLLSHQLSKCHWGLVLLTYALQFYGQVLLVWFQFHSSHILPKPGRRK